MKTLNKILLLFLIFSFLSCQNTNKEENIKNNEKTKSETQIKDSVSNMQTFSINAETITKDWNGKVISQEEFSKYLKSGEYIYVPKAENGKLVEAQLQKPTAEQMELLNKMNSAENEAEKIAPDFEVEDINGKKYKLSSLKDKTVVLNFWFVGCKPCLSEIPLLNKLVEKNNNTIFIAFATDKEKQISDFLKKHTFKYNIVANSKNIAQEYGITAYPTHYVIKNGKIKNKFVGFSSNIQSDIQSAIDGKLIKDQKPISSDSKNNIMLNSGSDIRNASGEKIEMMEAVKLINTQKYTMENAKDKDGKSYILIKKR